MKRIRFRLVIDFWRALKAEKFWQGELSNKRLHNRPGYSSAFCKGIRKSQFFIFSKSVLAPPGGWSAALFAIRSCTIECDYS